MSLLRRQISSSTVIRKVCVWKREDSKKGEVTTISHVTDCMRRLVHFSSLKVCFLISEVRKLRR